MPGNLLENVQVKLPLIERIWHVDGSLELDPPRSAADAFDRLSPLLEASGTTFEIDGDTLTYTKENPAAQDKLATFTRGTLQLVEQSGRSKLFYKLSSPALLMCFLAPLLFLGFAQAMILINDLEKPATEARADAAEEDEQEDEVKPLHPLDVFLGAPAPEKPEDKKEEEEDEDKGHSPTPAYVFAALFAALYVVGRILEPWLVRRHFSKALSGNPEFSDAKNTQHTGAQHPS
ncbi:hypothetical protein GCM10009127_12480 [Alteraurantiacibacter aestuarii]|uniref:Uncharacterized protein n=1 Tax=Alteraurantiacibacter aestuarii TaxID=650004 RepID=A0A844ZKT9_9SPHN|nr:hypothetical protein [Alteraurantiacibacter aestuarii]MXO88163.1 hypothetical protein [Alteraurantiacibacter aestuarii]